MKNWQKSRNYRKCKNPDGSFSYMIKTHCGDVEVSEAIYIEFAKTERRIEYVEHDLKRDRFLKDADGKAVLDENGVHIKLPEREVSLEKLIDEGWDFTSTEQSPEEYVISTEQSEVDELYFNLAMLDDNEQALIRALFFDGKTIREYAEENGKSKSSVDRQKTKILEKLKNFYTD